MIDPHGGVPNPLVPIVHNWKGGPYNEGSLFHGPIYTRPMATLPYQKRPLYGVGAAPMNGLGQELVDTRYGTFATPGHGEGIFNLNTAFGSDEPSSIQTVPGAMNIPQLLAKSSGPPPVPLLPGMPTPDIAVPLPAPGPLPDQTYDQRTLQLQVHLNQQLLKAGFFPINPDGKLGPETCGALQTYNPLLVPVYGLHCTQFPKPKCYRPDKDCGFPERPDLSTLPSLPSGTQIPSLTPCSPGQVPTLAKPCLPAGVFPPGTPGAPAPTNPGLPTGPTNPGLPNPGLPTGPTPEPAEKTRQGVSTGAIVLAAGLGLATVAVAAVMIRSMKKRK